MPDNIIGQIKMRGIHLKVFRRARAGILPFVQTSGFSRQIRI
ncbi:MAG: hypothetical protein P8N97_01695 [Alphaproteobacteria bacterium]|nr:hypothetical protein [Alphaproteobacteria bacterium]